MAVQQAPSVEWARDAAARESWAEAYAVLRHLDEHPSDALAPDDLDTLADAAWWAGHVDESLGARLRAHAGYAAAGDHRRAGYAAWWIYFQYRNLGRPAAAAGWLHRARHHLEQVPECPEQCYLAWTDVEEAREHHDPVGALAAARRMYRIARQAGSPGLVALSRQAHATALLGNGRRAEGLAVLDDAMCAVTAGELNGMFTGWLYCLALTQCMEAADFGRAVEWTTAAMAWCAGPWSGARRGAAGLTAGTAGTAGAVGPTAGAAGPAAAMGPTARATGAAGAVGPTAGATGTGAPDPTAPATGVAEVVSLTAEPVGAAAVSDPTTPPGAGAVDPTAGAAGAAAVVDLDRLAPPEPSPAPPVSPTPGVWAGPAQAAAAGEPPDSGTTAEGRSASAPHRGPVPRTATTPAKGGGPGRAGAARPAPGPIRHGSDPVSSGRSGTVARPAPRAPSPWPAAPLAPGPGVLTDNPFRGLCRIHHVQVLDLLGEWALADAEAELVCEEVLPDSLEAAAEAQYVAGEIARRRGRHDDAAVSYTHANDLGRIPQPGLALLRLAQGKADAAVTGLRLALVCQGDARHDVLGRARLRAAQTEVDLAVGDIEGAAEAVAELLALAGEPTAGATLLGSMADTALGALELARHGAHDPDRALRPLRRALAGWLELRVPYEAAQVRVLLAAADRAAGDDEAARLELTAARAAFEQLGAVPDARRAGALISGTRRSLPGGLTTREAEVLRLVAAGGTNRDIARSLVISEHTVARHLNNIFAKLGVSSRAAATAYAYSHGVAA